MASGEEVYRQRYRVKKRLEEMPVIEYRDDTYQCDTMFYPLRGKTRAVFCGIEMTTRIGFIRAYAGATPTATGCVRILEEMVAKLGVKHLSCDPGSEFNNKAVKDFCKSAGIDIYYTQTGETKEKGMIERFNKTVREQLNQYVELVGWNWVKGLPAIEEVYNHKTHRSIGEAPADVDKQDKERIRQSAIERGFAYLRLLRQFKPGNVVRVAESANPKLSPKQLASEKTFRKGGAIWTKDVYEVERIEGYKVKLKGYAKRFSPRDLQIVGEVADDADRPDVVEEERKRKKAQRVKRTIAELDNAPAVGERTTRSKGAAPEFYKIEAIVGHRAGRDGRPQFHTKWAGMPNSSNTWEYAERFAQQKQMNLLKSYAKRNRILMN